MAEVKATTKKPAVKPSKKVAVPAVAEMKARASFVHLAPRKVRLVAKAIIGKSAKDATDYLQFVQKAAVKPMTKLINSAIANASHNFNIEAEDLVIKNIRVDEGPTMKRYRPRAHGRSTMIRKRMSNVVLTISLRPGATMPIANAKKSELKKDDVAVVSAEEARKQGSDQDEATDGNSQQGQKRQGALRKVFNRKTG